MAWPDASAATQKVVLTPDSPVIPLPGSMLCGALHAEPFHIVAFPAVSPAMQDVAETHDTVLNPASSGDWAGAMADHDPALYTVILGVLALGLTGLKAGGLTNAQSFRSSWWWCSPSWRCCSGRWWHRCY